MDILSRAIQFASEAFDGMCRKGAGEPAVLHSMEAAVIAGTLTEDQEVLAAAALHDTVEDAEVELAEIERQFGARVAALVESETENKRKEMPPEKSWRIRKEEALEKLKASSDPGVKILYLGDKLSNLRSLYRMQVRQSDGMWEIFHEKNPEAHHWYYRAVAEILTELNESAAWKEYDQLIRIVFKEKG